MILFLTGQPSTTAFLKLFPTRINNMRPSKVNQRACQEGLYLSKTWAVQVLVHIQDDVIFST